MNRSTPQRAMTLIELVMVVGLVIALVTMVTAAGFKSLAKAGDMKCTQNLCLLNKTLELYRLRYDTYPPDYPEPDLKLLMGSLVDRDLEPGARDMLFRCPFDAPGIERMRNVEGYDEFYFGKTVEDGALAAFNMVVSCPHHGDNSLYLLADGSVDSAEQGVVYHSTSGMLYPGQIAIGGEMAFSDGVEVNFEGHQCANYIQSTTAAVSRYDIQNQCDETVRLLPGEIGDFHVTVPEKRRLCILTCVATLRAAATSKDSFEVDLNTSYGGGDTPRSGPYTLLIEVPEYTNGKVDIRPAEQTIVEGPNPVKPGESTKVIDNVPNRFRGGRCTPAVPVD